MSDELLPDYQRELATIRGHARRFGEAHPKIAARLGLDQGLSADPHVERMIQAFAYLTARVRHKLEDDFPEITESLLGVLYPHYRAPIPSMAVVQFELDPGQNQVATGHLVPRLTQLQTDPVHDNVCLFRTCYPVALWPIELTQASLAQAPVAAPNTRYSTQTLSIVRLVLECRDGAPPFGELALRSLRFFLNGLPQHVFRLYELILNNTLGVALAASAQDETPLVLDRSCLRPVGFERDEGMFPETARSLPGYRLLTEFFTFPEKYLFFDLTGLDAAALARFGNRLEVFLYVNEVAPDLEANVSTDTFRLGCTPVVNLYSLRAEAIPLSQTDFEYRVVPDVRRPLAHEVYSIDRVIATAPSGQEEEFYPFYSIKHARAGRTARAFWHATRRESDSGGDTNDSGTEVFLSLVDLGLEPVPLSGWTVDVTTTCLNRDLPHQLPFGGGQPRLQFSEGGALVSQITCLTKPSRTLRPAAKRGALWRLISHLSLNHLSLGDTTGEDSGEALREILKLYDFADSAETRKMLDGILQVRTRADVGRPTGAEAGVLCRGVEVSIQFDETAFSGSGLFLFASVLERFLALYCTVNSFVRLIATIKGREGELRRWQPRVGDQAVL
jgi:type VI secretion system protein ImpG